MSTVIIFSDILIFSHIQRKSVKYLMIAIIVSLLILFIFIKSSRACGGGGGHNQNWEAAALCHTVATAFKQMNKHKLIHVAVPFPVANLAFAIVACYLQTRRLRHQAYSNIRNGLRLNEA